MSWGHRWPLFVIALTAVVIQQGGRIAGGDQLELDVLLAGVNPAQGDAVIFGIGGEHVGQQPLDELGGLTGNLDCVAHGQVLWFMLTNSWCQRRARCA
ncbi:hypothetical protein D3C71_1834150 [compost metagenome]